WGRSGLGAHSYGVASAGAGAPAPTLAPAPAATHGIAVGQRVFHNKFGEGTVRSVQGSGDDARAQIDFPRHGTKWLALAVAKLTVVD
ncbi:MAG: DNA helicase II, partial [Pseudomonadota bacterium]|nr:DNA helicase II [Pseudomonadota bacterium]